MGATKERVIIAYLAFAMGFAGVVVSSVVRARHDELKAMALLAFAALLYAAAERTGWLSRYFENGSDVGSHAPPELTPLQAGGGLAGFFLVNSAYVQLTGGPTSPFFFVLYQPLVMMALRFGARPTFVTSILLSAIYTIIARKDGVPVSVIADVAFSFPLMALFGAMLNARLRRSAWQLNERIHELDALVDVSRMLETAIDLRTTLNLVLINAPDSIDFKLCAVYLCDDADPAIMRLRDYVPRSSRSDLMTVLIPDSELRDSNLYGSDKPIVFSQEDVKEREKRLLGPTHPVVFDRDAGESAYALLRGAEGLIGTLCFSRYANQPRFNDAELSAIAQYAMHVGLSLQQALYRDRLERLAFNDSMTGLANYRYFEKRLAEEMSRCQRHHVPLSVIMIDIDFFKCYNDTYGHKAGDMLLAQVSQVMREALRDSDIPARYGGEEFVIVCPETSVSQAQIVMERIREAIQLTTFALPEGPALVGGYARVTVSVGSATFPQDALNGEHLVMLADKALYSAKESGRNRSVMASDLAINV